MKNAQVRLWRAVHRAGLSRRADPGESVHSNSEVVHVMNMAQLALIACALAGVLLGWVFCWLFEPEDACGLCGQKTNGTLIDGVLYCDDCLSPEEVAF